MKRISALCILNILFISLPLIGTNNQSPLVQALNAFSQSLQTLQKSFTKELEETPRYISGRIDANLSALDPSDINEITALLNDIKHYKQVGGTKDYSALQTSLEKKLKLAQLYQAIKNQLNNLKAIDTVQELEKVISYIDLYQTQGGTADFSAHKKQIQDKITLLQLEDSIDAQEKKLDTITTSIVLQKLKDDINHYYQLGGTKDYSGLFKTIQDKLDEPQKVKKDIHGLQAAVNDYVTISQEVNESIPTTLADSSAVYLDILDKFSSNNDAQIFPKAQLAENQLKSLMTKQLTNDEKNLIQQELIPSMNAANQKNIQTVALLEQHLQELKKVADHAANSYPITNPFIYKKDNPYQLLGINRLSIASTTDIDEAFANATSALTPDMPQYQKLVEAKTYITTIFELDQQEKQAAQDLANAQKDIKEYKNTINKLTVTLTLNI